MIDRLLEAWKIAVDFSVILPVIVIGIGCSLIWKKTTPIVQATITFSFLGLVMGMSMGLSDTPVVGVIIPAILTFVAGITVYLFVNERSSSQNRWIALMMVISLSFFLHLGGAIGSKRRQRAKEREVKKHEESSHVGHVDTTLTKRIN